jgi:hypothetical protein
MKTLLLLLFLPLTASADLLTDLNTLDQAVQWYKTLPQDYLKDTQGIYADSLKALAGKIRNDVSILQNCPAAPISSGSTNAMVSWTPPITRIDGTPLSLSDITGFRIYYGQSPSSLTTIAWVPDPHAISYTVIGLTAGTWYFAVSGVDTQGVESPKSSVASKTLP